MTKVAKLIGVVLALGAVAVGLGAATGRNPDDRPRATAAPVPLPAPADPPAKAGPPAPPGKAAPAPVAEERVTPGVWVRIRSTGSFVHDPLDDVYRVEAGGTLPLSPTYGGWVKVGGMTVVEAEKAVEAQLHKILKGGRVTLTLTDPPGGEADLGARVRQLEREVRDLKAAVEELRWKQ
jgi:hypothetical protein